MKITIIAILCLAATYEACEIYGRGVSTRDQNTIVTKHNELRKLIANGKVPGQPRGVNLKRLSWDKKLASAAQKIADSCIFAHQKVNDGRFYVGQNLYISMSTSNNEETNWDKAISSWFDEHKIYRYPGGFSLGTGHYTQVVWANTDLVGCGFTFYEQNDGRYTYKKLYVCNYGPAGNFNNEAPYETGSSGCENLC